VNDCNEWKTEKRHECTNIGKLQTTQVMMATVHNFASGSGQTISGHLNFLGLCVQENENDLRCL